VLDDGALRHSAHAHLQQVEADVARAPQCCRRRRQHRLGEFDQAADQAKWALAKSKLGPSGRAKEARDQPEV
jgi:hypothetical protein